MLQNLGACSDLRTGKSKQFFYQSCLESTAILSGGFQLREGINLTCYCFIISVLLKNKELINVMICNE